MKKWQGGLAIGQVGGSKPTGHSEKVSSGWKDLGLSSHCFRSIVLSISTTTVLPCGTALGPIPADNFTAYVEAFLLNAYDPSPFHYFRFLDDTFAVCPSRAVVYLDILNSLHQDLKFTCELEYSDTLSFFGRSCP